jgi:hypothetical protein
MPTIFTHCDWNLGDHLVHLHYLRKQTVAYPDIHFVHAANYDFLPQMIEVVADVPNISLIDIAYKSADSQDAWKNRDDYFVGHGKWADYAAFYIEFFDYLSKKLGLESPIHTPQDFLFDYPAIQKKRYPNFDFLVINSPPKSGQFLGYSANDFDGLIGKLLARGYSVITTAPSTHNTPCTQKSGLSVTAIGSLSLGCKYIVGVSTGPSWPTFNIWNTDSVQLRVLLLDRERVLIAPNTEHAKTIGDLRTILSDRGLI